MKTLLAALAIAGVAPATTWAALGQPLSSVAADHKRLGGELRSTSASGYSVHEISAADGNVVREYVSPAGEGFAVAWEGPTLPNLPALLRGHFPAFRQPTQPARQGAGPVAGRTDRLVAESGGHRRAFPGRAYLPDRLPAAVSETGIRCRRVGRCRSPGCAARAWRRFSRRWWACPPAM